MPKSSKQVFLSLVDHLDELKFRIIYSLIAVIVVSVVAYFFRNEILAFLVRPLTGYYSPTVPNSEVPAILEAMQNFLRGTASSYFTEEQISAILGVMGRFLGQQSGLIFIHPTEAFLSYIKLALFTGIFFSAPIIIYQIWKFLLPALFDKEQRFFFRTFGFGTLLFFVGSAFAFLVVLPLGIKFLLRLSGPNLQASFTIGNYLSFTMMFILVFGVLFELPVVIFLLVQVGIVSREFLARQRKYMILVAFIVSAILTPPDVVTQLLLAGPLIVLYEISLILARFAGHGRREKGVEVEEDLTG